MALSAAALPRRLAWNSTTVGLPARVPSWLRRKRIVTDTWRGLVHPAGTSQHRCTSASNPSTSSLVNVVSRLLSAMPTPNGSGGTMVTGSITSPAGVVGGGGGAGGPPLSRVGAGGARAGRGWGGSPGVVRAGCYGVGSGAVRV